MAPSAMGQRGPATAGGPNDEPDHEDGGRYANPHVGRSKRVLCPYIQ